ncbi:MAG: gamma carbonic anhydrase family protein [Bacillota bacterium]
MLIEYNGKKPKVAPTAFVAPNATLIGDVVVEEEASIWFGAVLRADYGKIVVGARSSVQDNVVVHVMPDASTDIGEEVTVAHGAVLHTCTIGRGALIGMNAVILDYAVIGEQSLVAAGAVVTERMEIPARHLAVGSPASIRKELSGSSLWWVVGSSNSYVDLAKSYLKQGIGRVKEE